MKLAIATLSSSLVTAMFLGFSPVAVAQSLRDGNKNDKEQRTEGTGIVLLEEEGQDNDVHHGRQLCSSSYTVTNRAEFAVWMRSGPSVEAQIGVSMGLLIPGVLPGVFVGVALWAASAVRSAADAGNQFRDMGYTSVPPGQTYTFTGSLSLVQDCNVVYYDPQFDWTNYSPAQQNQPNIFTRRIPSVWTEWCCGCDKKYDFTSSEELLDKSVDHGSSNEQLTQLSAMGLCVGVDGDWEIVMRTCDVNDYRQHWIWDRNTLQIQQKVNTGLCLTSSGDMDWCYNKVGDEGTGWNYNAGEFSAQYDDGKCLESGDDIGDRVRERNCKEESTQRFAFGRWLK